MDYYKYTFPIASGVTYFGTATNNGLFLCLNSGNNDAPVDVVHRTGVGGATAWFRYRMKSGNNPLNTFFITPAVAAGISYSSGTISVLGLI